MTWFGRVLASSVGRKQLVALTGLLLCGFLIFHLAGNLLILAGAEKFDAYAKFLHDNAALVIVAEIGLIALFVTHIGLALRLTAENHRARGGRYGVRNDRGSRTVASETMAVSGLIVLAFLVIHLINFKFADRTASPYDGSLYRVVVSLFQGSVGYVIWYVIASCVLGLHLSHGLQSAFQTLGVQHPRYSPWLRRAGYGFAALIAVGYSILPIFARWYAERVTP
jgi:succinate dehydrogenase / fumarate reductase cytochrome b subunit